MMFGGVIGFIPVSYTHLDGLSLLYSLVQITDDVGKRTGFGNSHSRSLFVKGGLGLSLIHI